MFFFFINGCNSTPSNMWTPNSKIFLNYHQAYEYFLDMSPSLDDNDNIAKQFINTEYKDEYIVIENRVQIAGYHNGEGNCAKRPYGKINSNSYLSQPLF